MFPGVIGTIVGLIGTVISRVADIYEKKSESTMQLELAKENTKAAQLELQKEQVRAQAEENAANITAMSRADEANAKAEAAIMSASYSHDKVIAYEDQSKIGAFIRGILRPTLTIVYSGIFLWLVWYSASPNVIESQAPVIFAAFIEVAVGITLWWFGIRRSSSR